MRSALGMVPSVATVEPATMSRGHLHYASPYRELETARETGELGSILADASDVQRVSEALDALSVPESYGTAGALYVTHAPTFVASRDASTYERVNLETAERELVERFGDTVSLHEDACERLTYPDDPDACACDTDAWSGRSRSWLVGYVDELAVRPFACDDRGRWTLTDAWTRALELAELVRDGESLDEDELYARERAELMDYVSRELGDTWSFAVVDELPCGSADALSSDDMCVALRELVSRESARVRAHERLRVVGDGQLSMLGDEPTRVPVVTDPAALGELVDAYGSALHGYDLHGCAVDDGALELVSFVQRFGIDPDYADELAPLDVSA